MTLTKLCTWQVYGGRAFCASTKCPLPSKSCGARQAFGSDARQINFRPVEWAGTERGLFFDQRAEELDLPFDNSRVVYNLEFEGKLRLQLYSSTGDLHSYRRNFYS